MPIAPNQQHLLSPTTKNLIKKAKPPKRVEDGRFRSKWLTGKNYRPPTEEERKRCPF